MNSTRETALHIQNRTSFMALETHVFVTEEEINAACAELTKNELLSNRSGH